MVKGTIFSSLLLFCVVVLQEFPLPVHSEVPEPENILQYEVPLDHFDITNNKTFNIRVFQYSKYATKDEDDDGDGPIFFYAGNEGSLEEFYYNTGLMFDWAEEFHADIVFAEHRYYGESLPFGEINSFDPITNLKWLRVEQVLNDYAKFMVDYNTGRKKQVVAFGGSYGGILAAFLRLKFPTIFDVALAASAPIPQIFNQVSPKLFYQAITNDAKNTKQPDCVANVRKAFQTLEQIFQNNNEGQLEQVQKTFNLCHPLQSSDWNVFMQYVRNAWTEMAMCDYPYPTNFLAPLPAYPITEACKMMSTKSKSKRNYQYLHVDELASVVSMVYGGGNSRIQYTNNTSNNDCLNMRQLFVECADQTGCGVGLAARAWDYQICADIPIVVESDNITDMFPVRNWTFESLTQYCMATYNIKPDPYGLELRLGLKDFATSKRGAESYSNIIFSNGKLDPWHSGGYLANISNTLVSVMIPSGAHHLDLRERNNDFDPTDVIEARIVEKNYVTKWLNELRETKKKTTNNSNIQSSVRKK